MISEEEAVQTILAHIEPLRSRRVALSDAIGSFAAEDVLAPISLPLFDNSAMDGWAVFASSTGPGARLKIVGEQPAGLDRGLRLQRGEAIRIFTGAPLPEGADAVVMQEETRVEGGEVVLENVSERGEFVRTRGGDVAEGQKVLGRGERINAGTLALLAALGTPSLTVGGKVRVAVVSTGDELAQAGATLERGQIYESNSILLRALLEQLGAEVVSTVHSADEVEPLRSTLGTAMTCDVVIITGGVSVGARDLVKSVLIDLGATLDLWRVSVKPGKPFLFGHRGETSIFGLPGNPVSAFVTFLLFVRPALLKLMGAAETALPLSGVAARLGSSIKNPGDRPHYIRGLLRDGTFAPAGRQESHALVGLSRSNALVRVVAGADLAARAEVTAHLWNY
ncbi:MAG: molybdopterin molybdotransferase MoeA [Verrucomicrobiota bacterium]|nr:molybdopterin molybdotransferase MoeA [Verrucomicrobiota bacterium]